MPTYKLLDAQGLEVTPKELQNKGAWCTHGVQKELAFVQTYGSKLDLSINPSKEKDPYVPDLCYTNTERLADLKTQNCPFFQARRRFDMDPQYTVVFNHKDREHYESKYPDLDIFFWIDWRAIRFENGNGTITVNPMTGVWRVPFSALDAACDDAPEHAYLQRRNDQRGNAKSSYVISLNDPMFTRVA